MAASCVVFVSMWAVVQCPEVRSRCRAAIRAQVGHQVSCTESGNTAVAPRQCNCHLVGPLDHRPPDLRLCTVTPARPPRARAHGVLLAACSARVFGSSSRCGNTGTTRYQLRASYATFGELEVYCRQFCLGRAAVSRPRCLQELLRT